MEARQEMVVYYQDLVTNVLKYWSKLFIRYALLFGIHQNFYIALGTPLFSRN